MRTHRSFLMLLCAVTLAAGCEENAVQDITAPPPGSARVKFFNFGVGAPGVNFYANDTKITAITSATGSESTNGVNYGAAGNGGLYMAIQPGQYTLTGRIAAATDKNLVIASVPVTIADGRSYSFYQSGKYNTTTKTVDAFVLEDAVPPAIDFSVAHVRFVNAIHDAQPMTLYGKHTALAIEGAMGTAVAYRAGGTFIAVPPGTYDIYTRYTGSDTNVISREAVSFVAGRVYTIAARGEAAGTMALDNTANR